jgi:hypothetical protein
VDEIGASSLLGCQSDDDGSDVDESDLPNHGGPAREGRALEMKEQKNAAKEAFNATTFAQLLPGPDGRQSGSDRDALLMPTEDA